MFQFSEILTLAVGLVALTYLVAHRRRAAALPLLRPFIPAFLLLLVSWTSTVVEGFFVEGVPPEDVIQFWQESVGLTVKGGTWGRIFNWLEHLSALAAGVWLCIAAIRLSRTEAGSRS